MPESTDLVLLELALVRKTDPVSKALESAALAPRASCRQYDGEWWKQDEWLLNWLTQRAPTRRSRSKLAATRA
ncbi:MAG: hypothetical protein IPM84_25955 [Anaerolineae bacterium]|nr:hypothetical protein [Anaerolineae bacterium]